jgi:hypothetical protein
MKNSKNTAICSKNIFEMDSEGEVYNFSSSKYQELEKNICSSETEATDVLKKDKSSKSSNSDVKEWSPKYKRRKHKYINRKKKMIIVVQMIMIISKIVKKLYDKRKLF